ncbi:cation:proton antiporter [Massilia sp. Leaf139]|uniref:cation:proton antiporter n=1 Tax=Massilia sp. Leaf139 TaxID=1736272 RepID=UPI0006F9F075|nr:cation:proton antiporter [Massilia sp. Leaf139]KQQ97361.1 sodium:proton antiporter [Massilia sp. Leaf139]
MPESFPNYADLGLQLAWPLAIALSWMAGELIFRWTALPRIAVYGLAGFVFGNLAAGYLPPSESKNFMLLANLGFGLILFELGYRINLRWLRNNPWIVATSVLEAVLTFAAVYLVAGACGMEPLAAALTASLAMSSSPAGLLRVLNEQGAAGQVTERAMHLTALNCVMAVFTFNVVVGIGVFQTSGDLAHAAGSSLLVLGASSVLGALFGALVPLWLRMIDAARDATLAFALAVVLLVSVTHVLQFSPVLAALTFGLVARHRRIALSPAQRNFGVLGDLLAVLMFFFVATKVEIEHLGGGIALGLLLVLVRALVKVGVCTAFARVSGISARKGALSGLALTPMAVFAILLMEQTRWIGVDLFDSLAPLAAVMLLLDVLGPVLTQRAVVWADETRNMKEV